MNITPIKSFDLEEEVLMSNKDLKENSFLEKENCLDK
jgi:hypothetical protein